jgi:hypothetical protein
MAILLATASLTTADSSRIRPNVETGSGLISGRWVLAAKFPAPRGLARGYRKKAVDGFLEECANGVNWLHALLVGAEKEIDRLNGLLAAAQDEIERLYPASPINREVTRPAVTTPTLTRSISRAAASKQRKRPAKRTKRLRTRLARQHAVLPS